MCSGPEDLRPSSSSVGSSARKGNMNNKLTVETEEDTSLLELAANNELESFKKCLDRDPLSVDEVGLWYGCKKGSNQMVQLQRTPLMVAATYDNIDIFKFHL